MPARRCLAAALALITSLAASASGEIALWTAPPFAGIDDTEPADTLEPIVLPAARNGSFSGLVMLQADQPITNLEARLNQDFDDAGIRGRIRYAVDWDPVRRRTPPPLDILLDEPPPSIDPAGNEPARTAVWLTVDVAADAAPGTHHAALTVQAHGLEPVNVAVELRVADWTLPATDDWRTWIELIQSPDTLALEYDAELWSDRHWELIARSFELMSITGSRVVYIPLVAQTNHGNEQSMVRWVRGRDGELRPDYTIAERYLDTAREHLGEPAIIVLYAWDTHLLDPETPEDRQEDRAEARLAIAERGVPVTIIDEASGDAELGFLPPYWEADESHRLWRPVYEQLRQMARQRGLENTLMLGTITDMQPTARQVQFLADVSDDLPWVAQRHPSEIRGRPHPNRQLRSLASVAYEAHVYHIVHQVNPELGRKHGWRIEELRAAFPRGGRPNHDFLSVRTLAAFSITGGQRGLGRIGADLWPAIRDRRGRRSGPVYARYPESNWRALDIESWILAAGPDEPVASARLENLREGLQECEARIFIEDALLEPDKRDRVGDDLARRAQALLDDRHRARWRSVWPHAEDLEKLGEIETARGHAMEVIWETLRRQHGRDDLPWFWDHEAEDRRERYRSEARAWFFASDWRGRSEGLFELAGEIERRLR